MTDSEYQEQKITKLLNEMSSVFYEIQRRSEFSSGKPEEFEFDYETNQMENRFLEMSKNVYMLCLVYIENKKVNNYLKEFIEEMGPLLKDRSKSLCGSYDDESGEVFSEIIFIYSRYLSPFAFYGDYEATLLKRTGISFLENTLESTGVIVKGLNKSPTSEAQVYNVVKIVCQATFHNATFPSQSFQKTAKCYIPDILIPSLNCAIEYKYADTENRLIETIDQILIDVKGYNNHPLYKIFYAVFYVKPGIWTKSRFDEVWREKEFPNNWKGILVI